MNNHTQSASGHEKDSAAARSPPAFSREEFLDPKFDPKLLKNIVKEGIIVAAGAEAILLQVASPGVGAGVNEHSNFAYRVQDRLRTTLTFGKYAPSSSLLFSFSFSRQGLNDGLTDVFAGRQYTAWHMARPKSARQSST